MARQNNSRNEESRLRWEAAQQRQKEYAQKQKLKEEALAQRMTDITRAQQQQLHEQQLRAMEKKISEFEHPYRTEAIREAKLVAKKTPKYFGKFARGALQALKFGVRQWKSTGQQFRERQPVQQRFVPRPEYDYSRRLRPSRKPSLLPSMREIEAIQARERIQRARVKAKAPIEWVKRKRGMTIIKRAGQLPEVRWS